MASSIPRASSRGCGLLGFYVDVMSTSDGGLAYATKATESNVLLRALCRDDDTPSMDGLDSDVTFGQLRYSYSIATMSRQDEVTSTPHFV
jgi:hypothetical protein